MLEPALLRARRNFPAVVLTGPRRVGKTVLLKHILPDADYRLLEDPDVLARVRADPRGFFDELKPPVILDEAQNAPELLAYVRTRIDAVPRKTGQWFLTGSQESALMQGVSESLAGRAAILHLLPLSTQESPNVDLWLGGFPEVVARPRARDLWFSSYLQTYLERDVREVTQVRDLATFRQFMGLVASRHGQILNKTDLAGPLGASVHTVAQWLRVLETTGLLALIPPYFENFGKRLLKSRAYIGWIRDWRPTFWAYVHAPNWSACRSMARFGRDSSPRRSSRRRSTPGERGSSSTFGMSRGWKSTSFFQVHGEN